MPSIFTKIIKDEIPSFKIHENDDFLAFLDVYPLKKGHTLVIPKQETDYIFDIKSNEYLNLWNFAKIIAKAIKKVIKCKRVSIVVIGLEVPHAHIHLIPIDSIEDINFDRPKLFFSNKEMENTANIIREAI
ncbi:MAG: HIT domain-containing protein [Flavobacteriales bacterium]|jgi:histidine triad (HIT) family protein|nr:HIT domain-containing protein [Flavobacteriales bacterium]